MEAVYTLTPRLRVFLKEPLGLLIKGSPQETMAKLGDLLVAERPPGVISVGDVVSQNLHDCGINPQLSVIDYVSLRDNVLPRQASVEKTVYVQNPQGTITMQAVLAVKAALESGLHTHIVVEGEEDLLTLIAVLYAPKNSFIVYGQPYCGIVVVRASSGKKAQIKELLNEMKISKS
ncbi:MAG: DUF359 domain-containing protein [Nitrososphaerota archaeon]|jgi:uncharacterized protein (UPF0218 family)|nr:DUF359 domain-containing protein [Nitrososphaerota archaeon]